MFFRRSHDKLVLINERIRVKIRRIKAHYLQKTKCSNGEINVTTSGLLEKVTKSYFADFSDVFLKIQYEVSTLANIKSLDEDVSFLKK